MSTYKASLSRKEIDELNYETVTNADRFDKRQFNSIFKASGNLQKIEQEQSNSISTTHQFLTDVWSGLYKMNPQVKEEVSPELTVNKQLMEYLLNNEDFQNYRQYTRLDELGSVIGATKYSYQALNWLNEEMKQNEGLKQAMEQMQQAMEQAQENGNGDGSPSNQGGSQQQGQGQGEQGNEQDGDGNGQQQPSPSEQAQQALEQVLKDALEENGNSLNKALKQANDEAKEDNEQVKALMGGTSAGSQQGELQKLPLGERVKLAETLSKNGKMKKIAEWAGRFKAIARQKQKSKSNSNTAKSGIEFGNDVENLLPMELLLFSQGTTKLDFLRRFSESQTLQYKKTGKQAEGKGAIVACLDQSGSMRECEAMSKGFILALLLIAKKQRRDFAYIPFDSSLGNVRIFPKGKISTDDIIAIAQEFLGGGTNFERPLRKAQEIMDKGSFKKGDIIFITDGEASLTPMFQEQFMKSKKDKEFSLMTIAIGSERLQEKLQKSILGEMSDVIISGDSFENKTVVNTAFSI